MSALQKVKIQGSTKVWPRLKPLRRDASPSEIIGRINALVNRENVDRGYPNDPRCEDDYDDPKPPNAEVSEVAVALVRHLA